jgi:hypothetical protein
VLYYWEEGKKKKKDISNNKYAKREQKLAHTTFEQQYSTNIQHPGFPNPISPIYTNTAENHPNSHHNDTKSTEFSFTSQIT